MKQPRKRTPPTKNPLPPETPPASLAGESDEVLEFIAAIDAYKRGQGRPFPSWSEVLGILKQLGYEKHQRAA